MQARYRSILTVLALGLLLPLAVAARQDAPPAAECPEATAQVVIDPGHGGDDPGAVVESPALTEANLNLEIARLVEAMLEDEGIAVALTRDDDATTLGNSERGNIANACGASILVMMHLNAATDPETNYTLALWGEKTKDLALSAVMLDALEVLGIDQAGPQQFDNGGLLRAAMPSVLVEAVFMTNPAEAKALAEGERQEAIARAVADGVLAWLRLTGEMAA
jgi:N-acetylmuramoyl-L-alanine amidase